MGHYDTMQVCLQGHQITVMAVSTPERKEDHCSSCGAGTITQCPHCNTNIRGYYRNADGVSYSLDVPMYCHSCGTAYPWTVEKLKAAQDLIDLADVSDTDKASLKADLPALISDTPRTQVAAAKLKLFVAKAGSLIGEALHKLIVDIASDTAKKALGL